MTTYKTTYLYIEGTPYCTLPALYEKYGLSISWLCLPLMPLEEYRLSDPDAIPATEEVKKKIKIAIKYHWLVCRYLEEHQEVRSKFLCKQSGFMYYDILDFAEQKYLGMKPYGERENDNVA